MRQLKALAILPFMLFATITFGQTVKDTTKSKGINSTNVTGNNNHIVGGSGNSVGINGDVNVNVEKKLGSNSLQAIGAYIDDIVKNKGFDGNNIVVYTESYATYPKMSQQIIEYLKNIGYNATEGFSTTAPVVQQIKIDTLFINRIMRPKKGEKKKIGIYVGRF